MVTKLKELSAGLLISWKMAAIETGFARHQFIEKEQIVIGICSLEKVFMSRRLNLNLNDKDLRDVKSESESIKAFLSKYKLNSTGLRREVRKKYGQGTFKRTEKIVHRSEGSKEYFKRAELLADNSNKVGCLHLFAAILENPEGVIQEILKEQKIKPKEMQKKALFFARISQNSNEIDSYVI